MAHYAKAIVGAFIAGLGALVTGLADDALSNSEWLIATIAFLIALGGVWAVPNKPAQ
ncbi:MAG TPA: hypothetical protein VFQ06_04020 [Nitrospira sp.]|nr:hypothetical protein [Nitrospira sp.]